QFSVEVAFVVIIASTLLRLRHLDLGPPVKTPRALRAVLALACGTLVAVLSLLAVGSGSFDPALTDFYSANSLPRAHGRNVVNVILVDFRAVDTLGEISAVFVSFLAAIPPLKVLTTKRRLLIRRSAHSFWKSSRAAFVRPFSSFPYGYSSVVTMSPGVDSSVGLWPSPQHPLWLSRMDRVGQKGACPYVRIGSPLLALCFR